MDIAPPLAPSLAPAATTDPVAGAPNVPNAPGEAFADVFAQTMGDPLSAVPIGNVDAAVAVPVATEIATTEPAAQPVPVPRPGAERTPAMGTVPIPPPDPPPATEAPRKEAANEAPNAPAQEPDRPQKAATPPDPPAIPPFPVLAVTTNVAPVVPEAVKVASSAEAIGARAGFGHAAPTEADAPGAVVPSVAPGGDVPALESAPDLGIVPQVSVAVVSEPAVQAQTVQGQAASAQAVLSVGASGFKAPATVAAKEAPKAEKTVDKSTAPTASAFGFPAVEEAAEKGDAPAEDAPKDGAPSSAPVQIQTAATERPEAGADRPVVDRHLVVRQVADRIENLVAARPRDGVTIHLEPRDLGTVTLVVKGLASALDVQMTASDERVRQSLDASRPELAQALAPRNIAIRELRVSASSSSGGMGSGNSGANPDERPRQGSARQPAYSPRTAKTAVPTAARRSGRGVDLLV